MMENIDDNKQIMLTNPLTLCRVCLKSENLDSSTKLTDLTSIFEIEKTPKDSLSPPESNQNNENNRIVDILEMITYSVIRCQEPTLPSKICKMCLSHLRICYSFINQFNTSQNTLLSAFAPTPENPSSSVKIELVYDDPLSTGLQQNPIKKEPLNVESHHEQIYFEQSPNMDNQEQNMDIKAGGTRILSDLLPQKSGGKYKAAYSAFLQWKTSRKINDITEDSLLNYFQELAKCYNPSSLWNKYSMLRATIMMYQKINIESYKKITTFIKKNSIGFQPKTAKALARNEINEFLKTAPDLDYLLTKVVLIVGISGACGNSELVNMTVDDVSDQGYVFIVRIGKRFTIYPEFYATVKKYVDLRPKQISTNRFFINYKKGKCLNQVIGKNQFGIMCKTIALFLNLDEPERYTAHSFRRLAAGYLVDAGADSLETKSDDNMEVQSDNSWKLTPFGEAYTDVSKKRKIGRKNTVFVAIKREENMKV